MKVNINGKAYDLAAEKQAELLTLFQAIGLQKYAELETPIRLAMKAVAREILRRMEKKLGKSVRPESGADPCLHLVNLFLAVVAQGLNNAEANITTDEATARITDLTLSISDSSESGG